MLEGEGRDREMNILDFNCHCSAFPGQFETYLYQRGVADVMNSVKKCWSSCFSERVLSHRLEIGMPLTGLKMAVVIQVPSPLH